MLDVDTLIEERRDLIARLGALNELILAYGGGPHGDGRRPGRKPGRPAAAGRKGRRKMSASAKARLSAIAKKRWAKARAAGKSRL